MWHGQLQGTVGRSSLSPEILAAWKDAFVSKDIQGPVFSLHTSLNLNSIANIGSFLAKLCQQAKHIVH